ncbi:hypothetical protein B0H13DRAFT_471068 [Mycena leptocephala]|nr:hypothetical protein B0H13DRAFT_471068 [Mycena leptocephala]
MSFVSNVDHLTLGDGVYNNVHGNLSNIVHNTFYWRKRPHEQIGDAPDLLEPTRKRRQREEDSDHGVKVIRNKHLKLTLEIGSGPGYFLHTGETKGRTVIVKVFNSGPTVREHLESTVALSKGLFHPNVLRIEGVSSPASLTHFIAYENAYWKLAKGALAAALQDDLTKSITLGFKMIAGLSSGMNHLSVQGISLGSLGVENFDIFLDINDRFLISINPHLSTDDATGDRQDNTTRSWAVFNALCQRVLRSANRVLHNENIERTPVITDILRRPPVPQKSLSSASLGPLESHELSSSQQATETEASIPPRREYVWRTIERGQQSLATIATRIALDLDMKLSSSVNKLTWSDGRSAHRCAGYVREEITLASTTGDSAVVFRDAPSPLETCLVCHEVVGVHKVFRCICGDPNPGARPTVKCPICEYWSHSDCVRNSIGFACETCVSDSVGPPQDAQTTLSPFTSTFPMSDFPVQSLTPSPSVWNGKLSAQQLNLLRNEADLLRRETNEWRMRAGVPAIQKPHHEDGQLPAQQSLKKWVDSVRQEVNQWRMCAGIPPVKDPRHFEKEADSLRQEAKEWRMRAGIPTIQEPESQTSPVVPDPPPISVVLTPIPLPPTIIPTEMPSQPQIPPPPTFDPFDSQSYMDIDMAMNDFGGMGGMIDIGMGMNFGMDGDGDDRQRGASAMDFGTDFSDDDFAFFDRPPDVVPSAPLRMPNAPSASMFLELHPGSGLTPTAGRAPMPTAMAPTFSLPVPIAGFCDRLKVDDAAPMNPGGMPMGGLSRTSQMQGDMGFSPGMMPGLGMGTRRVASNLMLNPNLGVNGQPMIIQQQMQQQQIRMEQQHTQQQRQKMEMVMMNRQPGNPQSSAVVRTGSADQSGSDASDWDDSVSVYSNGSVPPTSFTSPAFSLHPPSLPLSHSSFSHSSAHTASSAHMSDEMFLNFQPNQYSPRMVGNGQFAFGTCPMPPLNMSDSFPPTVLNE